jgi:hypothetical protein
MNKLFGFLFIASLTIGLSFASSAFAVDGDTDRDGTATEVTDNSTGHAENEIGELESETHGLDADEGHESDAAEEHESVVSEIHDSNAQDSATALEPVHPQEGR